MVRKIAIAALMCVAVPLVPAAAQELPGQTITGTRLDIAASGEVNRVPDIARISAGVVTQAPTATEAIRQNAARMDSVLAALRRAGIAERDIQTSSISLHPDYRYIENQPPRLTGYRASNEVTVKFRDLANAGRILDALVAEGANQINGPMLGLEEPEEAMNEARLRALANARARADVYARSLGMRVKRILSVSEGGPSYMPSPRPMAAMAREAAADTQIVPGEQAVTASLNVSFELE